MFRIALVACALSIPVRADAELIGFEGLVNFTGVGHGTAVSATLASANGTTYSAGWAGELNWLWGADGSAATIDAAPDGFAQAFYSYCADITEFLGDPQLVTVVTSAGFYQSEDSVETRGGAKAAWLFNKYAYDIRNELVGDVNDRAAALQIAIWEAMYDTAAGLTSGSFRLTTTGDVAAYAAGYLEALYSHSSEWTSSSALVLSTRQGQDQITNVPEPAMSMLFGIGLALIAIAGARRGDLTKGGVNV
jgi:hypothetical protein